MDEDNYLYHGTIDNLLDGILTRGLRSPSYWGSARVAEYYARDGEETLGYAPILIRKPLTAFINAGLDVDRNSVAEPLTDTLKASEEELYSEFTASNKSWQASWEIYESVLYRRSIVARRDEVIYLDSEVTIQRARPFFWKVLMRAKNGQGKVVEFDGGARLSRRGLLVEGEGLLGCELWGGMQLSAQEWNLKGLSQEMIEAGGAYWRQFSALKQVAKP